MYLFIPFVIVPLGIWAYLYYKSKDANTPRVTKLINTLGSTMSIMGLTAMILWRFNLNVNILMSIIMLVSLGWAIYFYFFWGKKKNRINENSK
jgi:hypothetical protein